MTYHHIILEPSMFNCLNFVVKAEDKAAAYAKLIGWTNHQVETTRKTFEGAKDQASMVRFIRDYWACGMQNRAYMGILKDFPDFKPHAFIV